MAWWDIFNGAPKKSRSRHTPSTSSGGESMTSDTSTGGSSTSSVGVGDITGGIGSIATAVGGIVNGALDYVASQKQLEFEKRQLRYQKQLQQLLMAREDTAIQRRVIDYQAAGLSPVLAAGGSGAQAGPVVATTTPQVKPFQLQGMSEAATLALSAMKMEADISATKAQEKYLEMQAKKAQSEKNLTDVTTASKRIDLSNQQDTGLSSKTTGVGSIYNDLVGALKGKIAQKVKDLHDRANSDNPTGRGASGEW